jgi:hypothetical protein|tara:strand:- start:573 stop:725 length:153 start_codon:yes stop_codon:yes gene_type:complete
MSITLTFAWWAVPTAITICSLVWALSSSYFDIMVALFFSMWAWIIAGILK